MNDKTVDVENAGVVPRGNYKEVLEEIIEDGDCPFCEENLPRRHKKPILYRNGGWLVTENQWPYDGVTRHLLFIVRRHVERIEDLHPSEQSRFFKAYVWVSKTYKLTGASLLWRSGNMQMTGASVRHLHAQMIVGAERRFPDHPPITGLLGFQK